MRKTRRSGTLASARAIHTTPLEDTVHALVWIGIVLLVLWGVLWLGFNIVSGVVHLLVIAAIALIAWGLLKKGARAVDRRL